MSITSIVKEQLMFQKAVYDLGRFRHNPETVGNWNLWVNRTHPRVSHGRYAAVEAAVHGTSWVPTESLNLIPADQNKVHSYQVEAEGGRANDMRNVNGKRV